MRKTTLGLAGVIVVLAVIILVVLVLLIRGGLVQKQEVRIEEVETRQIEISGTAAAMAGDYPQVHAKN